MFSIYLLFKNFFFLDTFSYTLWYEVFNATFTVFWISFLTVVIAVAVTALSREVPSNFYSTIFASSRFSKKPLSQTIAVSVYFSFFIAIWLFALRVLVLLSREGSRNFGFFSKYGFSTNLKLVSQTTQLGGRREALTSVDLSSISFTPSVGETVHSTQLLGLGNGWGWDFLVPATSDFIGIVQLYLIIMTVLISVSVSVSLLFKFSATDRLDHTANLFHKYSLRLIRSGEYVIRGNVTSRSGEAEVREVSVLYGSVDNRPEWHFEGLVDPKQSLTELRPVAPRLTNTITSKNYRSFKKIFKGNNADWRARLRTYDSIESGLTNLMRPKFRSIPEFYLRSRPKRIVPRSFEEHVDILYNTVKSETVLGKVVFAVPKTMFIKSVRRAKSELARDIVIFVYNKYMFNPMTKIKPIVFQFLGKLSIFEFKQYLMYEGGYSRSIENLSHSELSTSELIWEERGLKTSFFKDIGIESNYNQQVKDTHRNLKVMGGSLSWANVDSTDHYSNNDMFINFVGRPVSSFRKFVYEDLVLYKFIVPFDLLVEKKIKETEADWILSTKKYVNSLQYGSISLTDLTKKNLKYFLNFVNLVTTNLSYAMLTFGNSSMLFPFSRSQAYSFRRDALKLTLPFFKFLTSQSINKFWVYHSAIEFAWTIIPCLILVFVSVPSFALALALDENFKPQLWVKVIGNQWFWVYEYSSFDEYVVIDSVIQQGSDLKTNALRLLAPDTSVTIPYNKFVRFLVTSVDVIHSWAVPALGIKVDACPGRINSVSILPNRLGIFYGQCSEICGVNHAFMPIAVEVVA